MNKLLRSVLCGAAGFFLAGCGQPSQPTNLSPTSATPTGVAAAPAETPPQTVLEKAGKGSGKQGRLLDKHEGIYVTPAKTFFTVKEKIVFEILIPDALNKHNAIEGHYPKSHDEFMQKVIGEFQIQLPELPAGHEYVYDPMNHELMVEKPAQ